MLFASVFIVMFIGMVGIVLPFVPGLILMWLAALTYGVVGDFHTGGAIAFAIITVLLVAGEVTGFVLPGRAAGKAGAPSLSIVIGAMAACIGFFVIPVFGFPVGGILGIFVAETLRTGSSSQAWTTTTATLLGFGVGVLAQLGFGVAIIATWLIWVVAV